MKIDMYDVGTFMRGLLVLILTVVFILVLGKWPMFFLGFFTVAMACVMIFMFGNMWREFENNKHEEDEGYE